MISKNVKNVTEQRFEEIIGELQTLSDQKEKMLRISKRLKFDLSRIDKKIDELSQEAVSVIFELTET